MTRRTARLELFLNEEEKSAFAALAEALGVPVATWARLQLRALCKFDKPLSEQVQEAKKPAKPVGRPGKTVEAFLDLRTSHWEEGARRFTGITADMARRGMPDMPEAHALYEKCARAAWSPQHEALDGDDLREYYDWRDDYPQSTATTISALCGSREAP